MHRESDLCVVVVIDRLTLVEDVEDIGEQEYAALAANPQPVVGVAKRQQRGTDRRKVDKRA